MHSLHARLSSTAASVFFLLVFIVALMGVPQQAFADELADASKAPAATASASSEDAAGNGAVESNVAPEPDDASPAAPAEGDGNQAADAGDAALPATPEEGDAGEASGETEATDDVTAGDFSGGTDGEDGAGEGVDDEASEGDIYDETDGDLDGVEGETDDAVDAADKPADVVAEAAPAQTSQASQAQPAVAPAASTAQAAQGQSAKAYATTAAVAVPSMSLTTAQQKALLQAAVKGLQDLIGLGDGKKITYNTTLTVKGLSTSSSYLQALNDGAVKLLSGASSSLEDIFWMYPQLFYFDKYGLQLSYRQLSNTISGSSRTLEMEVTFTFVPHYLYTRSQVLKMRNELDTAVKDVMSWVPAGSGNEAEKAKAVHDWLVRNCTYDLAANRKGSPEAYGSHNPWNIYGALVNKKAVCQGYAYAFKLMMDKLGITCTYVTNTANGQAHGWNRVCINGKWYNIDVTHDDPVYATGKDAGFYIIPSTKYFMKSDAWFIADSDNGLHTNYSPRGTAATDTSYDKGTNKGAAWKVYGPSNSIVKIVAQSKTYTGKALAYTGTTTKTGSTGKVTFAYYTDANCTKPIAASQVKNAGTYYVRATLAASGSWMSAVSTPVKFTIAKAPSSIKLSSTGAITKKGSNGAISYHYYSDAACKHEVKAADVKANASYYVRATVAANANYNAATSAAVKIKMKASSAKLAAQTKAYTGKALAYTGKLTKKGSSGSVTYHYYSDAACKHEVKAANVKAAGTYYVRAVVAAKGVYAAAVSPAVKFTVTAPIIVIPAVPKTENIKNDSVALAGAVTWPTENEILPFEEEIEEVVEMASHEMGLLVGIAALLVAGALALALKRRKEEQLAG